MKVCHLRHVVKLKCIEVSADVIIRVYNMLRLAKSVCYLL